MAEKQNTESNSQMGNLYEKKYDDDTYFGPLFNEVDEQENEQVPRDNIELNLSDEEPEKKTTQLKKP